MEPAINWMMMNQMFTWAMEMVFDQTSIHLKTVGFSGGTLGNPFAKLGGWNPGQVKNRMGRMPWIFGEP